MIPSSFTLEPEHRPALETITKRVLDPRVWSLQITGSQVLVVPDPVDKQHGALWLPASAIERRQLSMGAGWIVAAGPFAGSERPTLKIGLRTTSPTDLLGLHIYFQAYSGINFKTSAEDDEFGGPDALVVLDTSDIFAWDTEL